VSRNLIKSAHGLSFLAVREDELAADATGVNATRTKVTAFVVGAAIAGMAGVLYAHYNGSVPPDDFKMDTSFILVAMVVIGGTGSITGAAVAGITLKLLEEGLRKVPAIPAIDLFALLGLAVAVFAGYRVLAKRGKLHLDGFLRPLWVTFGALLCLLVPFAAYATYGSELSWVLKSAAWVFMGLLLVGLLVTTARAALLARFGFFGFCIAIIFLAKPVVTTPLNAFGPIVDLVGKTTYMVADLRWAIFSLALVFVMILRPQGVFGHHEFSWSFVRSLFRGRVGGGASK
jgi:branched-chain amino acid transport system permease protein